MWIDTTRRSNEAEIMDDLEMEGDQLRDALDQLARINKWLGGNRITLRGVKKLLKNASTNSEITIVDYGCGNGEMLREIADFGRKKGYSFSLIGIDANQAALNYGIELSEDYPEISFSRQNVLSTEFSPGNCDIALCTLFLHHFKDEKVLELLKTIMKNSKYGLVVNDLHRHPLAYKLFSMLSVVFDNQMVIDDGLTSIKRSFKKSELIDFQNQLKYPGSISWRWAFRWEWIIKKL